MGGAGGRARADWLPRWDGTLSLCRERGTALASGVMARGLLLLLLVVFIIETRYKNNTEALVTYNGRIIARREVNCNEDEYHLDAQCCKKCKSGFVKNIICPTDIIKHCVPCEKGKEFMDHLNDLDECHRCKSCDGTLGLEVVKNCTPAEDTKCACAKNYFCSSVACDSCSECTPCDGAIEKQCTSTSDTVCGAKGMSSGAIVAIVLAAVVLLAIIGAFWWKKRQKGFGCITARENLSEAERTYRLEPSYENVPFIDTDADLNSHIAGIVAEMTLSQVKTFVRHHHVPEPAIDQIIQDCLGDTSEQKIKLFRDWYQRHGMKGAYGTLISSLRELNMRAVADKIEEKLKAAVSHSQEGGLPYNGDTEQSRICTQEGRNSSNGSDELSKALTGSLEET